MKQSLLCVPSIICIHIQTQAYENTSISTPTWIRFNKSEIVCNVTLLY
ncbi:hypothetical protein P20495_0226 [Pseudoalteromonas sp. BSi20495]|nr:hypothetical protein P20495_0226 [Pseudoalteromonas sp. BSi20495]